MSKKLATIAAAMTIGLLVTAIAWAAEGPESTVNVSLDEGQTISLPVDAAGVVVLNQANQELQIFAATPNSGFTAAVETGAGREVEAEFRGGDRRFQFNAELEDGVVRIRIREEASEGSGSTASTSVTSTSSSVGTISTGATSPSGSTASTASSSTTPTAAGRGSGRLILSDGQVREVAAGDAGSVLLRRNGGSLTIVSTRANPGWVVEVEVATGREVEGDFRNGSRRVKFNFELEDGVIRIRIESEGSAASSGTTSTTGSTTSTTNTTGSTSTTSTTSTTGSTSTTSTTPTTAASSLPAGTVTYDLDGAGNVTVVFNGGQMSIETIRPAAGWKIEESEQRSDEIRVELTNGDAEAELRVRISNGELRVEIDNKS